MRYTDGYEVYDIMIYSGDPEIDSDEVYIDNNTRDIIYGQVLGCRELEWDPHMEAFIIIREHMEALMDWLDRWNEKGDGKYCTIRRDYDTELIRDQIKEGIKEIL